MIARSIARPVARLAEAAKRGKVGYTTYDPAHDERRQEFLTLLGELRRAVDADELVLHYSRR